MNTTFFVDIDQTISTGHKSRSLAESVQYYRAFGLTIPDGLQTWPDLFQLPEVLRRHEVLPYARVGVWRLSEMGKLAYATVRKPEMRYLTYDWLDEQGFPCPGHLIVCQSVYHKLLALAQYESTGPLVLVDDRWRKLLEVWPRFVEQEPAAAASLQAWLTLVAFGSSAADLPASPVVPVVPLASWASVDAVLMSIHKERKRA